MTEDEQAPPPQGTGPGSIAAPEISRRVGSILDAVEREAARLREEARVEAAGYLDNARRRADDLVAERQRRIGELSDELVAKSEAVIARLDDAAPVRQGFENLVRALGDAAERLAREADGGGTEFEPPPFGARHAATAAAEREPVPQPYAAAEPYRQGGDAAPFAADAYGPAAGPPQPGYPAREAVAPPPAPAEPGYPAHAAVGQPRATPEPGYPAREAVAPPRAPAEPTHPARAPAAPGWRGLGGDPVPAASTGAEHGWREQDEARMVAIQMAATGATRGAVREHLHHALGLDDTGAVLDEVFGPGSGEGAQVPWTASRR